MFVVLEGTDGSGKATQVKLLADRLTREGRRVAAFDFPQYGKKSAGPVEEYLNGKYGSIAEVGPYRASVFFAVDRYDASSAIKDALTTNDIVLANRYVPSNLAHHGSKIEDATERSRFIAWCEDLEYRIFGVPKPDFVLILHMPAEIAQTLVDKKGSRDYVGGARRDLHETDTAYLKATEQVYLELAQKQNMTIIECSDDGKTPLSVAVIHEKIWKVVHPLLSLRGATGDEVMPTVCLR